MDGGQLYFLIVLSAPSAKHFWIIAAPEKKYYLLLYNIWDS